MKSNNYMFTLTQHYKELLDTLKIQHSNFINEKIEDRISILHNLKLTHPHLKNKIEDYLNLQKRLLDESI